MPVKRAITFALIAYLALRLFTSLVVLAAALITPPNPPPAPFSPAVVRDLESRGAAARLLVLPWYRWDTTHYLEIADEGYRANLENSVWPPLYPALIRLFGLVFKPSMLAALVVSNLAAVAALALLYLLAADTWNEGQAQRLVIWTVIFPSGFFLLAAYTESLFLAFSAGALLAARRRSWLWASILGTLAALTRIPGVLLAAPLLWEAWRQVRPAFKLKGAAEIVLPLSAIPLSLAMFSVFVRFNLDAPWPWSNLAAGWNLRAGWPWEGIIGNLRLMAAQQTHSVNTVSQFYDVLLALLAVFLLAAGLRRLPVSFTLYSAVLLLPALVKILDNGSLMSLLRYVLPLFPLWFTLDRLLPTRGTRFAVAAFFLFSQGVLLVLFYRWVWVA